MSVEILYDDEMGDMGDRAQALFNLSRLCKCKNCSHIADSTHFYAGKDLSDPMLMADRFRCPKCRLTKIFDWVELVEVL